MKNINLLQGLEYEVLIDNFKDDITNIEMDSRKLKQDGCFVAIKGLTVDGHDYIEKAYQNGARFFIVERDVEISYADVTVVKVKESRKALAVVAKGVYNNVDENLKLIGVTGTNGKTSTTYFISHILNYVKRKTLSIGTLGVKVGNEDIDLPITASTTPEFTQLFDIFSYANEKNINKVVMEVSSHSLELDKVYGLNFEVGIFTNLTQDHLDFHKTMENYFKAKTLLFKQSKVSIINIDDAYADRVIECATGKVLTYGIEKECDYQAKNLVLGDTFVEFDLTVSDETQHFKVNVPGRFTVYNLLGTIGAVLNATDLTLSEIAEALLVSTGVPGRVQTINSKKGFSVIVDYAHTPDALEKVIETVRETTTNKIITVFGCGGDRDSSKRPIMGKIATSLSDYSILTSDNPRFEEPENILNDIEKGVVGDKYIKVIDRREAIQNAIKLANKGDKIIIAGKGHEDYQIIGDKKTHFDDYEITLELLEEN